MDFQIVIDSLRQILIDIANFIPNLINGLIILLVGYLISALVRWGLRTFLNRCKFDALVERTGITDSCGGWACAPRSQRLLPIVSLCCYFSHF